MIGEKAECCGCMRQGDLISPLPSRKVSQDNGHFKQDLGNKADLVTVLCRMRRLIRRIAYAKGLWQDCTIRGQVQPLDFPKKTQNLGV